MEEYLKDFRPKLYTKEEYEERKVQIFIVNNDTENYVSEIYRGDDFRKFKFKNARSKIHIGEDELTIEAGEMWIGFPANKEKEYIVFINCTTSILITQVSIPNTYDKKINIYIAGKDEYEITLEPLKTNDMKDGTCCEISTYINDNMEERHALLCKLGWRCPDKYLINNNLQTYEEALEFINNYGDILSIIGYDTIVASNDGNIYFVRPIDKYLLFTNVDANVTSQLLYSYALQVLSNDDNIIIPRNTDTIIYNAINDYFIIKDSKVVDLDDELSSIREVLISLSTYEERKDAIESKYPNSDIIYISMDAVEQYRAK